MRPHRGLATARLRRRPLPSSAQLAPAGQKPLKVKGTGFLPDEHVQVTAKGQDRERTVADSQGTFVVSLPGVNGCDSVTVDGERLEGSHAEFNLSQIVCIDNVTRGPARAGPLGRSVCDPD